MKNTEATGGFGAIYARISHIKDEDQTGVERQERTCRETAERLGITVDKRHVFVDPSRSAWQRKRKRPGWDSLLEAIRTGEVRHVIAYHPDRLMRQPKDLEELLDLSRERQVMLYGMAGQRDLANPDDVFILRIEIAHACRSSDDTSRRVLSAQQDALTAGRAHGGRRAYGYAPDNSALIQEEAEIVREIFRRFLDGGSINGIATELNKRQIPTASGKQWNTGRVRQLIDSPRHAGLIVFRDEVQKDETGAYRLGGWPACVSVGEWEEARRLREGRSLDYFDARRNYRPYLLRGLVVCTGCGRTMVGNVKKGYPTYSCTRPTSSTPDRCKRVIGAERLEEFAVDAAKDILSGLTVEALSAPATTAPKAVASESDEQRLAELQTMWEEKEVTTAEYRAMRKVVAKRIAEAQRATVVRPITALEGIEFGEKAAESFDALPSIERKAAVLRWTFAAIRIGPSTTRPGVYDFSRIDPEPNDLTFPAAA
jgi:DNA invertase Pin-like site-specific DNA recombinase